MQKKKEESYLNHQNFWKNSDAYSTDGYEGFKTERRKYLANLIVQTKPKSVLEIGCFGGYNLIEINSLDPSIKLTGFDINNDALSYAKTKLPNMTAVNGSIYELEKHFQENQFDVVFTAGVLIHIPSFMEKISSDIINISKKFVFHAEHHGISFKKIPDRTMRYIHNFEDLYKSCKEVKIEDAPDPSNGFEQIIKIAL